MKSSKWLKKFKHEKQPYLFEEEDPPIVVAPWWRQCRLCESFSPTTTIERDDVSFGVCGLWSLTPSVGTCDKFKKKKTWDDTKEELEKVLFEER